MRRPKQPGKSDKAGGGDKAPPGGRARKRLEQFNLQRGLPTTLPSSGTPDHEPDKKVSRKRTAVKK